MSDKETALELFKMADEFINVANRLVEKENIEIGEVGAALRYAAARFNAHEAAYKAKDLAAERSDALAWFSSQYNEMLEENLDQHIKYFEDKKASDPKH
jgi:phosphopantetheinyl transferase (holo-ACP synthase)